MLSHESDAEQATEFQGMDEEPLPNSRWVEVCALTRITPGTGAAAIIDGEQIAVVVARDGTVYALSNFDPFSKAFVIARGIVGDREGVPKIASPIFKQTFDLRSGQCLDEPNVRLPVFPTRVRDGKIQVLVVSTSNAGSRSTP
jgi:nitrite reductase (NADH) small subunit